MNILLDYVFPIAAIEPTPPASTAFLRQVCVVAKPKAGQEANVGQFFTCTTMAQVAARTSNTEAQQLFDAGMSRVIVLLANTLDLEAYLVGHESDFYTMLISSDFSKNDIKLVQASGTATITSFSNLFSGTDDILTIEGVAFTAQATVATPGTTTFQAATSNDATATSLAAQINAHTATAALVEATAVGPVVTIKAKTMGPSGNNIDVVYTENDTAVGLTLGGLVSGKLSGGAGLMAGAFKGVVGVSDSDDAFLAAQAAIKNRCAFHTTTGNKAKNMFYAFGKLLSNALSWKNQQYVAMPFADDVDTLGECNNLFDSRISFVISDDQYANKLALFCAGGKAIVAPYIVKNLEIDIQSRTLGFIAGNQPDYTVTQATLLEDALQKVVDERYIAKQMISKGQVSVKLEQDNFIASGYINIAEPKALWRIYGEMRQTL